MIIMIMSNHLEYEKLAIEEDDSASTSSVSHENSVLSKVEMEKQILEHTEYLLSADAHSTVVLILELFPQLNSKIIKQFSKQGGKDGIRLEYTYCKQILGAKSRQIDSEQAELILELLDRSKVKVSVIRRIGLIQYYSLSMLMNNRRMMIQKCKNDMCIYCVNLNPSRCFHF